MVELTRLLAASVWIWITCAYVWRRFIRRGQSSAIGRKMELLAFLAVQVVPLALVTSAGWLRSWLSMALLVALTAAVIAVAFLAARMLTGGYDNQAQAPDISERSPFEPPRAGGRK